MFQNVQQVDLDQILCTTVVDTAWVMSHVIEQLEDVTMAVKRDILENCVTQVKLNVVLKNSRLISRSQNKYLCLTVNSFKCMTTLTPYRAHSSVY